MYKRLKKREYKKVTQKEFRTFYQATQKLDNSEYNFEEKKLYEEAVRKYSAEFEKFTDLVGNLEKSVNSVDSTVQLKIDRAIEAKIKGVFEQIQSGKLISSTEESKDEALVSSRKEQEKRTSKQQVPAPAPSGPSQQSSNLLKIPSVRTRTKSFDTSLNPDITGSNPD